MKKVFLLPLLSSIFLLLSTTATYAADVAIKAVITQLPPLISGPDTAVAGLYVASDDGASFTVNGTGGIDFRTGSEPGSAAYFSNPSPQGSVSVSVPADGSWVYAGTFQTQVKNDTGTCLTGLGGQVFVRPFFSGSGFNVTTIAPPDVKSEAEIVNIGAMIGTLTVNKSDGTPAVGASITISPADFDPNGGSYTVDATGQIKGIHRLNCSNSHTITATLGGVSNSLFLPAQSGSTPDTICNGQAQDFTITLSAPPPTTKYSCSADNTCVVDANGPYSSLSACQADCVGDTPPPPNDCTLSISPDPLNLTVGQTGTLTATEAATSWIIPESGSSIASVTADPNDNTKATVTGKASGTTTVTATTSSCTKTITITVTAPPDGGGGGGFIAPPLLPDTLTEGPSSAFSNSDSISLNKNHDDTFDLYFNFRNASNTVPDRTLPDDICGGIDLTFNIPSGLSVVEKSFGCNVSGSTITCNDLYSSSCMLADGGSDRRWVRLRVDAANGSTVTIPRARAELNKITNPHYKEDGRYPSNEWGRTFTCDNCAEGNPGYDERYKFDTNEIVVTVGAPQLTCSLNCDKATLNINETTTCTAVPSGGKTPYSSALWTQIPTNGGSFTQTNGNTTNWSSSNSGSHTVSATFVDSASQTCTASKTLTVWEPPPPGAPTCSFTATPGTGSPNLDVTFYGQANDNNGKITKFEWDFLGSGNWVTTGTAQPSLPTKKPDLSSNYTYTTPGTYYPQLKVTDDSNNVGVCSSNSVTVSTPPPPPPNPQSYLRCDASTGYVCTKQSGVGSSNCSTEGASCAPPVPACLVASPASPQVGGTTVTFTINSPLGDDTVYFILYYQDKGVWNPIGGINYGKSGQVVWNTPADFTEAQKTYPLKLSVFSRSQNGMVDPPSCLSSYTLTQPAPGTIGLVGTVYWDQNKNGIKDYWEKNEGQVLVEADLPACFSHFNTDWTASQYSSATEPTNINMTIGPLEASKVKCTAVPVTISLPDANKLKVTGVDCPGGEGSVKDGTCSIVVPEGGFGNFSFGTANKPEGSCLLTLTSRGVTQACSGITATQNLDKMSWSTDNPDLFSVFKPELPPNYTYLLACFKDNYYGYATISGTDTGVENCTKNINVSRSPDFDNVSGQVSVADNSNLPSALKVESYPGYTAPLVGGNSTANYSLPSNYNINENGCFANDIRITNVPADFSGATFQAPDGPKTVTGISCGTGCFTGGGLCDYPKSGRNQNVNIVLQPKASAWFGVDGDMYAGGDLVNKLPVGQYIVSASSPNAGGAAIAKCDIDAGNGQPSQRNWQLSNYSHSGSGSPNCTLNWPISAPLFSSFDQGGAQTITQISNLDPNSSNKKYRIDGNLELNSSIRDIQNKDFSAVIFVNGNLTVKNSFSGKQNPDPSDFIPSLAFIVKGKITFDKDVENSYGIFLADDQITDSGGDKGFIHFGSLISTTNTVKLYRDLGDSKNKTASSEKVVYQPHYLIQLADLLGRTSYTWREVAP